MLIIRLIFTLIFALFWGRNFAQNRNDSLVGVATGFNNAGMLQLREGNYKAADSLFHLSITVWDKVSTYNAYSSYPYYQLAVMYRRLGDFDKSFAFYNQTVEMLLKAPDEQIYILSGVYNNIGSFYSSFGDYQKSETYFHQAYELIKPQKIKWSSIYSNSLFGLARIYYHQQEYNKVIQFVNQCLAEGVSREQDFLQLKANSHVFLGEYALGISMLEDLGTYFIDRNELEFLYNLLFLARAYTRSGETTKAEARFEQAFPLLQRLKADNDPWFIFYNELYGQLLMQKAEQTAHFDLKLSYYSDALKFFDRALVLNSRSHDQKIPYLETSGDVINPTQVKDVFQFRTRVLKRLGELYEKQDAWLLARDYYSKALKSATATVNFLHDFRISFIEEESKIKLGEREENVYTEGLMLAEFLYGKTGLAQYFEAMLSFIEAGKSSVFLASLNDIQARNFGGIPDSLIEQERNIHLQLNSLKQARYDQLNASKPDSTLVVELNKSIFRLQGRQEALNFLFERDYPEYYRFKYRQVSVNASTICSGLSARQALVEYYIDEPVSPGDSGQVYALIFQKSGFAYRKIPISYAFIEKLQGVLNELTEVNIAENRLSNFINLTSGAHYLYKHLIGPLPIGEKVEELIIIPDGKLAYFPFDILLPELPNQQKIDYRSPAYLIYTYNLVYSYSATLHFEYFRKNQRKGNHILAYSPDYGETEVNINDAAYRDLQNTRTLLRPLPGAREEVMGLSAYHNSKAIVGAEATETSFKQEAPHFDILHLAMHTIVNDSLPMYSKLVFSVQSDSVDDGFLNTQEIYNMKLNARLAVLSACNTGTGKLRGGEGVMSLSRAFLYAGCPSIVMTLWEVEDKVSADIMLRFYHYLFRGYAKPEALQKAKIDHIKNADPLKAHPYFWQGYIVVGDPSPIKFNNNVLIAIMVFVGLLIFFIQYVLRKSGRHKKNSAN